MYHIIVIGCGGIGGNYIKELGRFLYRNHLNQKCKILLIDGDLVEESNISRQPFLPCDVGRNKAEVMAEILTETFEINCGFYPNYIDSHYQLMELEEHNYQSYQTILIGAVDNHACRKVMHNYFEKSVSCIYLDAANEYSVGEVVVAVKLSGEVLSPDRVYYYPEILQDIGKSKSEESCQQINIRQPQHIVTNLVASNLLLKCTVEILTEETWNGGIYYFDAFKGFSQQRGN